MSIRKSHTKKGIAYDVTVYAEKDESGKRNRVYARASTLGEARIREAELKAAHSPREATRDTITLNRYIDSLYWPIASKRLAATSLDTYAQEIRLRIKPELGKLKLKDIDRAAIQAMVDKCSTECVAKKALGVLKTILNEAMGDNYIRKNPACSKFAFPDMGNKRDNGLVLASFEEIYDMLSIVDEASTCIKRIAYTGLLQGLRPEERYALTWDCFDLTRKTLTISKARTYSKHGGVSDKEPKTPKSKRVIPIHPYLYSYLESTPSNKIGAFIQGADGNKISPSTARKRWNRFLADNPECPQVTIENMRHSFATAYLASGGRIEVLSRILGHSNISTTINRYYRPNVDLLRTDMALTCNSVQTRVLYGDARSSILRASTT